MLVVPVASAADPIPPPDGPADAQSAPDRSTAMQIAQLYGHPVVSAADTTETEQQLAQPDGSWQLIENTLPVRVQTDQGWTPVDTSLTATGSGTLVPQATAVPVQFSAGGDGPMARVQTDSGEWLSESWSAGSLPTPTVDGDTATYPEVLAGVDLKLTATATGMSEVLVVKSAAAAQDPELSQVRFGLDGGSLDVSASGGTVTATPSDGSAGVHAGAATWWDSSSPGASAAGPGDLGVPRPAASTASASAMTVDAAAPASQPAVVYPAYVDPDWTGGVWHRTFVDSSYPTTSYFNGAGASDGYQHVGYIDAANSDDGRAHLTRSLWDMDLHGVLNTAVVSAHFSATEVYSSSCTQTPVDAWITGGTSSATTWNNQPTWGGYRGEINAAFGYSSSCPGPHKLDWVITSDVQTSVQAGVSGINVGLRVPQSYESNWQSWKKFDAAAQLIIGYYAIPATPTATAVTPCWAQCSQPTITRSLNPIVQASGFVDDANQPGLQFDYKVCAGRSATPTSCQPMFHVAAPSDVHGFSNSAMTVPQALASTGDYEYQVQACRLDYLSACSDWSGWYPFTVDHVAPPAPTVSSTDFDLTGTTRTGQEFVPGSIQVGPNGGTDDFAYSYSPTAGAVAIASPTCPATSTDVWVKCAGGSVSFTATATLPSSNQVAVYAYDKAGNATGTTLHYDVTATSAGQPSHAWFDTAAQAGSSSVADWPGSASLVGLSTVDGTNVQWLGSGASPTPPYTGYGALSFNGHGALTSGSGSTPVATLDAAHSFTVTAWVHPTNPGTGYYTAVAQDSYHSAFYLQQAGSYWRLCMPQSLTGTLVLDCATDTGTPVDPTSWTLLVGEWDAPNRTLHLYVNSASDTATAAHSTVAAASTAPIVIGRAQSRGVQTDWWQGGIADPMIYPDLLDPGQIDPLNYDLLANCVSQGLCS
ncbi:MAG: hypothetical protein M3Y42_03670 [Actinomycetota bacterium]|nr:hypothetical protein [Actinomycetota bacterium]MDQ2956047.1 hypothetical protein [Actinomycetota bacterium]